jgi:hypothetical protein
MMVFSYLRITLNKLLTLFITPMKRILLASLVILLVMPSCKFIKTKILSKKVDTLSVFNDTLALEQVDTAFTQETANYVQPELQAAAGANQDRPASSMPDAQFYMIVGCFTVPENASKYAEKIRSMGYEGEVIPGHDGYQMVTAKSYGNFKSSIAEIDQFRSDVTPNAWVFVKK